MYTGTLGTKAATGKRCDGYIGAGDHRGTGEAAPTRAETSGTGLTCRCLHVPLC